MKQNKCSAPKTLIQNSPAALRSGGLPDLSDNTPFACLRGLAIFVSWSGHLFIVVMSCSFPQFSFSGWPYVKCLCSAGDLDFLSLTPLLYFHFTFHWGLKMAADRKSTQSCSQLWGESWVERVFRCGCILCIAFPKSCGFLCWTGSRYLLSTVIALIVLQLPF